MRYVFENAAELASVPAAVPDPKPAVEELPQAASTASQAASEPALQIEASAQDILTALYSVAEYQGNEVATICRSSPKCLRVHFSVPALCCMAFSGASCQLQKCCGLWMLICACMNSAVQDFATSIMHLGGRGNADEMAASLQELGRMQTTAAELRGRILDADAGLSRVGKSYLQHLTDWQEHSSITASLTHSLQVGCCC